MVLVLEVMTVLWKECRLARREITTRSGEPALQMYGEAKAQEAKTMEITEMRK